MVRHGLVLSGGGAKGAYGAGAGAALIRYYERSDAPITLLSGTSVGALNAVGIASMGPLPLCDLWRTINTSQVYQSSGWMLPWRVWSHGAAYDSAPLRALIERHISADRVRESPYEVYIHTTDALRKRQVIFTKHHADLLTGVYASASVPGAFPPVAWRGTWLVDGGTIDNSPIRTCIRHGADRITVIYLDNEPPSPHVYADQIRDRPDWLPKRPSIAGVMMASLEAMMDAHFRRDLRNVELVNQLVALGEAKNGQRHIDLQVFYPEHDLGASLDFSNHRMRRLVDDGLMEASDWLRGLHPRA